MMYNEINISPTKADAAEQAIVASIIADSTLLDISRRLVTPEMFYDQRARQAYETILKMHKDSEDINIVSFSYRFKDYIDFIDGSMTSSMVFTAASQIRDAWQRRKILEHCMDMMRKANDPSISTEILTAEAGNLEDVIKAMTVHQSGATLCESIDSLAGQIESTQQMRSEGRIIRYPTGITTIDRYLFGGLGPGQLVILSAGTSVGKTAVSLFFARTSASIGAKVRCYTIEMTKEEFAQRFIVATHMVDSKEIALGQVDWDSFSQASKQYDSFGDNLSIVDDLTTLDEISLDIARAHRDGKCDEAVIDYLQLVGVSQAKSEYEQIMEVTHRLKQLAKRLRIPILLLVQNNRAANVEGSPQLWHMKGNSSIEQDADIVIMLERANDSNLEALFGGDERPDKENTIIAWLRKNRQYKAGNYGVAMVHDETHTLYKDYEDILGARTVMQVADPYERTEPDDLETDDF